MIGGQVAIDFVDDVTCDVRGGIECDGADCDKAEAPDFFQSFGSIETLPGFFINFVKAFVWEVQTEDDCVIMWPALF